MNTTPKHSKRDVAFDDAAHLVVITQSASVNDLCVKLGLTDKRARKVMEQLINAGIVGPFTESGSAEVMIPSMTALESVLSV